MKLFNKLNFLLKDNCYLLFLLLFLSFICIGIFPLYCYESDGMHIIMGCESLYNQGFRIPPSYSYEYAMQPFVYYVIAGLKYLFPIFSCEELYCLLTGITTLCFIPITIGFIHEITNISKIIILLGIFLIPESMAIAMYPNTAILALLPFMIGLNALLHKKNSFAIVLLSIAPLFRVDIIMIYPVVLFIFLFLKESFKVYLIKSFILGIVILSLITLGFYLMQANPLDSTLNEYKSWNNKISLFVNLIAIFSFYNILNFILLPIGIFYLIKKQKYRILWLAIVPILLNHIVYGRMGCATKHYLYILPFVTIVTSYAILYIKQKIENNKLGILIVSSSLLIFLLFSLNIPRKSWGASISKIATGPFLPLKDVNYKERNITIGIGAGLVLPTADELMLVSGNAFYPLYIHKLKKRRIDYREQAYNYLKNRSYNLWGYTWEMQANLPLYLMSKGFIYKKNKIGFILTKDDQSIQIINIVVSKYSNSLKENENQMVRDLNILKENNYSTYAYTTDFSYVYLFNQQEPFVTPIIPNALYFVH